MNLRMNFRYEFWKRIQKMKVIEIGSKIRIKSEQKRINNSVLQWLGNLFKNIFSCELFEKFHWFLFQNESIIIQSCNSLPAFSRMNFMG